MSVASLPLLTTLYQSLSSTSAPGYTSSSVLSYCTRFLNEPSSAAKHADMVGAINAWLASSYPQSAVSSSSVPGLRVFVIDSNGTTSYDSLAGNKNLHSNIGVPGETFATTGKYLINENLGSRSYIMGAALSQSGVFSQTKFSPTSQKKLLYLATRQGLSSSEPIGFIVLAMDA